jgi:ABC-type Mn2+/Zn2+ transport system permease subunit
MTWLSGLAIGVTLAIAGWFLVVRNQVFVGAAIGQASGLGVALGLVFAPPHPDHSDEGGYLPTVFAVAGALLAAWICRRPQRGVATPESRTAWVFLIAASLSILVVARSGHGVEEIHRLVDSSLLGTSGADVVLQGSLAFATLMLLVLGHRALRAVVVDPEGARALGVPTALIERAAMLWIGLVVGAAIRSSGLLFAFGQLVLPAMTARALFPTLLGQVVAAPLISLLVTAPAFVLAHQLDLPIGQVTVAALCAVDLIATLLRRR